jgi:hypothetical protein
LFEKKNPRNFPKVTHEWSDGIAATQIRIAVKEGKSGSPDNQWILFDGKIRIAVKEGKSGKCSDNQWILFDGKIRIAVKEGKSGKCSDNQWILFDGKIRIAVKEGKSGKCSDNQWILFDGIRIILIAFVFSSIVINSINSIHYNMIFIYL